MSALSSILYFLIDHNILCLPLFWLLGISIIAATVRKPGLVRKTGNTLGVFFLIYGFANVFPLTSILNSWFLQSYGTPGQAMIVSREDTGSRYNDHNVDLLHIIVKTANGRDVQTEYDDVGLPRWPIRNAMTTPGQGVTFPVKYIPGAEHNIVVINEDASTAYGRGQSCNAANNVRWSMRQQYEFSPKNPQYIKSYADSLQQVIDDCRESSPGMANQAASDLAKLQNKPQPIADTASAVAEKPAQTTVQDHACAISDSTRQAMRHQYEFNPRNPLYIKTYADSLQQVIDDCRKTSPDMADQAAKDLAGLSQQ